MLFCKHCGEKFDGDYKCCPYCGTLLQEYVAEGGVDNRKIREEGNHPYGVHVNATSKNIQYPQKIVLKTNRSLIKYILLSLITFGIYSLIVMSSISNDINTIAQKYDGKKTMHYCLVALLLGPLTFGIVSIVWQHRISARIGHELRRREIPYAFDAASFWLWDVAGVFILVGPFIYLYKFFTAMNLLSHHFNKFE